MTLLNGQSASSEGSLQAWIALRQAGLIFHVETCSSPADVTSFHVPPTIEPPILLVDGVPIWGALAIGEFLAEDVPGLWPSHPRARASARSVAGEVLSGLSALRALLPFDVTQRFFRRLACHVLCRRTYADLTRSGKYAASSSGRQVRIFSEISAWPTLYMPAKPCISSATPCVSRVTPRSTLKSSSVCRPWSSGCKPR